MRTSEGLPSRGSARRLAYTIQPHRVPPLAISLTSTACTPADSSPLDRLTKSCRPLSAGLTGTWDTPIPPSKARSSMQLVSKQQPASAPPNHLVVSALLGGLATPTPAIRTPASHVTSTGSVPLCSSPCPQHSTAQPNTTQHNTTQHNTTQHNTTQHNTTQHNTTQRNTTQHNTTQRTAPHRTAPQHSTAQHSTAQHSTAQHSTTQRSAAQHSTAQRTAAQPSPAQPSPAQPTPAQHSTAQHKYPAECVAHRCPGHPHKGPRYYSLSTAGTVPAELYPALKTHLREHHGDLALLAPHCLATDPPQVLAPNVKPGIWFHDLPALARWMREPRRQAWLWRGSPRVDTRPTRPTWPLGGRIPRRGGHNPPIVHPEVGATSRSILAGAGLRGSG